MAAAQIDQFTQALFGKVESVIIVCAILILVVGILFYLLRLKAERGLIRVIRSSRNKRQIQKFTPDANSFEAVPHCPICNASMVKRLARRGASSGSSFCISLAPTCSTATLAALPAMSLTPVAPLGFQQLSQVSRHASDLAEKVVELVVGTDPEPLDDITLAITDGANV